MSKVRIRWETAAEENSVKLFEVYNTAHRSLLVLAADRATALKIAYNANHIHFISGRKDRAYPHVAEVRTPSTYRELANCGASLDAAIAQRMQGTLHPEGDYVCVGYHEVTNG